METAVLCTQGIQVSAVRGFCALVSDAITAGVRDHISSRRPVGIFVGERMFLPLGLQAIWTLEKLSVWPVGMNGCGETVKQDSKASSNPSFFKKTKLRFLKVC